MKLSTLFLGCILLAASCAWAGQPPIDRILIRKAERSLQIISDGRVLHAPVALACTAAASSAASATANAHGHALS